MINVTDRDDKIDFLRGIAALIVVLGHVFQKFDGYEDNFFFNIIFSIQMPMFMVLSGYCTIYSKRINSFSVYIKRIKKRTIGLLLPWLVWSFVAYFVIFYKTPLVKHMHKAAYHMEDAYWFLFSLWCIDMIYSICSLVSNIISDRIKKAYYSFAIFFITFGFFIIFLVLAGKKMGVEFLAIKYTLYYSIFFVAGIVLAMFNKHPKWNSKNIFLLRDIFMLIGIVTYFMLISRYKIMNMADTVKYIIIRFYISVMACYILIEVVQRMNITRNKIIDKINYIGTISLELYVVHWLLVFHGIINTKSFDCNNILGLFLSMFYFTFITVISIGVISVIKTNKLADLLFFGKVKKTR